MSLETLIIKLLSNRKYSDYFKLIPYHPPPLPLGRALEISSYMSDVKFPPVNTVYSELQQVP